MLLIPTAKMGWFWTKLNPLSNIIVDPNSKFWNREFDKTIIISSVIYLKRPFLDINNFFGFERLFKTITHNMHGTSYCKLLSNCYQSVKLRIEQFCYGIEEKITGQIPIFQDTTQTIRGQFQVFKAKLLIKI